MHKTITNISILTYFQLADSGKYDVYAKHMKPEGKFLGKWSKLQDLTYSEVEVVKKIMSRELTVSNLILMFKIVFKIHDTFETSADNRFFEESIFQLFKAQNWITQELKIISNREKNALSGEKDPKAEKINANERLAPFNLEIVKDKIAQRYSIDPEVVGEWKYSKVFRILATISIQEKIHTEYSQIK